MKDQAENHSAPMRPPDAVMRLRRMGASFPTRLSFMRTLLRRLGAEKAVVTRPVWQIDANGFGHAVYTVPLGGYDYSLVAVSADLPADMRTDRVIATAWDTAYVLYDGVPDAAELARIIRDAPKQEAARFTKRDLVLSRANKSVRLFDHVVAALRAGVQPDRVCLNDTGYLMRTTAVYGNGKFGIADRGHFCERPGLGGPFVAEMLIVWLIRGFTHDLVEHMGGTKLDRDTKRHLGIGNATGLGMAPFLVNHPLLLDAWISTRETALALVRGIKSLEIAQIERIYELVARVAAHLAQWQVADQHAAARIDRMRREWVDFTNALTPEYMLSAMPVELILGDSLQYSIDTQELIVALLLEPFGDIVDPLAGLMATPFVSALDPRMTCEALRQLIKRDWQWACEIDFTLRPHNAQFWYVSEHKMEPRLGRRFEEPGAERETPLDIARQVKALMHDLEHATGPLPQFLAVFPQHRGAVRRVQTLDMYPYAEIRDNLIAEDCLPIDLLRCKLAFFGAAKFDPKSDRWTRVTLAQGAPLFDELQGADDWWLPVAPL